MWPLEVLEKEVTTANTIQDVVNKTAKEMWPGLKYITWRKRVENFFYNPDKDSVKKSDIVAFCRASKCSPNDLFRYPHYE